MESHSIDKIHRLKKGKLSDKWSSYLPYYDALFARHKNARISLLEIGVQNGGSLETWGTFFQKAEAIIGCDIDTQCAELEFHDPRIRVVVGDAKSPETTQKIADICSTFDIVIDDGSHISSDILANFVSYFPRLKPGGVYVAEDCHTLYMDSWGGGVLNEGSAYAFFKKLIDVINHQFWSTEIDLNVFLRTFFPLQLVPQFITEGWIESIEFRNSIVTITKARTPSHDKLGERLITGQQRRVTPGALELHRDASPVVPTGTAEGDDEQEIPAQSLHAFIICWPGKEENCEIVASNIIGAADKVTVIYSTTDGSVRSGSGEWVQVPNEWFYGKKFRRSLELSAADITLQIQGDVSCNDWKKLIERCRHVHGTTPDLAVWGPELNGTWWDTRNVEITRDDENRLTFVANTDGITWSFSKPVRERLSELSYDMNNLGWGIESAAIAYAHSHNMLVARDMSVEVLHPPGQGYSKEEAQRQMDEFFAQLPPQEFVLYKLAWEYGLRLRKL